MARGEGIPLLGFSLMCAKVNVLPKPQEERKKLFSLGYFRSYYPACTYRHCNRKGGVVYIHTFINHDAFVRSVHLSHTLECRYVQGRVYAVGRRLL